MEVTDTALAPVKLLKPQVFSDERGYFYESFRSQLSASSGLPEFVQDNVSRSNRGVLRGLHFQRGPHQQAKLVSVLSGEIFDVAVDIRPDSPTFAQWVGVHLSEDNHHQLFIPAGFAHGFAVLANDTRVYYKCSDYYEPSADSGILWNDPDIGIEWPLSDPILSSKDQQHPRLAECQLELES